MKQFFVVSLVAAAVAFPAAAGAATFNGVVVSFFHRLARAGTRLYFMHGNRDFLLGSRFAAATGGELLADPSVKDFKVPDLLPP